MKFSGVVLAGGRSVRMGRDKALIVMNGETLLNRALRLLREAGCSEIFVSARADCVFPDSSVPILPDLVPDAGPLSGICAALGRMSGTHLMVIAVDLVLMTPAFMRSLGEMCDANRGVIAKAGQFLEPLAAIYPKALFGDAKERLERGQFAVKTFAQTGVDEGFLTLYTAHESERGLFANLNSPADAQALGLSVH